MNTVLVVSIVAPLAVGATFLAARSRLPKLAVDIRGIALQTVIIMVVLLAIAGAVATVLLTRGGEAVEDIERQDIARDATDFTSRALCEAAGFDFTASTGTDAGNFCT